MKKLFTTALLACFAWNGIQAQHLVNDKPDLEVNYPRSSLRYPFYRAYIFVDSPMIFTEEIIGEDCLIHFYDEYFNNTKSITLKGIKREQGSSRPQKGKDGLFHEVLRIDLGQVPGSDDGAYQCSDYTQYLFNQDAKFEYIEITYDEEFEIKKIEIKNEDGNILGTLPKECIIGGGDFVIRIGKIGASYYIHSFIETDEGNGKELFWKLNLPKEGSGISASKVKSLNGYPNPVKKNEYFHIDLDNKFIGNANIEIWDSKGSLTYKIPVTSSTTKIPTDNLKGLYIYKVTDKANKENKTGKFIVQ